jgi:hypothetical protein
MSTIENLNLHYTNYIDEYLLYDILCSDEQGIIIETLFKYFHDFYMDPELNNVNKTKKEMKNIFFEFFNTMFICDRKKTIKTDTFEKLYLSFCENYEELIVASKTQFRDYSFKNLVKNIWENNRLTYQCLTDEEMTIYFH